MTVRHVLHILAKSSYILTEFKELGDEIRVSPLTDEEFYAAYDVDKHRKK